MYKVFINDKVIYFTNNKKLFTLVNSCLRLSFYMESLTPLIYDLIKMDNKLKAVIIEVEDVEQAFLQFKKYFKLIKAAGGLVKNKADKKLFIYRLGKWDLPKGKMEQGESIEETAIREVEEECGIDNLKIIKALANTYHIYELNGKIILKETFWFDMISSFDGNLVPQLKENITKAEWLTNDEITDKVLQNTYNSIQSILC